MATNPHDLGKKDWDAGRILRMVCAGLAVLAVAAAMVVVLLPLPNPAAGGTCGPGRGAEPAIAAFFDPVSIGAGPVPSTASGIYQWQAFVGECQASTNARMVDALALLLLAGLFFLVVMPLVRRAWHEPAAATAHQSATAQGASPGWYPDPANPTAWRWWDGYAWAREATPSRQDWPSNYDRPATSTADPPATDVPAAESAASEAPDVPAEEAATPEPTAAPTPAGDSPVAEADPPRSG